MKLHQLIEADVETAEPKQRTGGYTGPKAGVVPFLDDGRALFAVPSDSHFGGAEPAIAKGRVDGEESVKDAAVREGEEELGLRKSNMAAEPFLGWSGTLTGLDATYKMSVYAVLVKDEDAFDKPDYETKSTHWFTRQEFMTKGRKSQHEIMDKIFDKIDAYLR
jgi:8-oxo-dGTP pyrophosphatase MutT (NUDIX family)